MNEYIVHYHFGGDVRVKAHSKEQATFIVRQAFEERRLKVDTNGLTSIHVQDLADFPTLDPDS